MQSYSKQPHESKNILRVTKKISTRKQIRKKLIPKNMVDLSSKRFLSSPNARSITTSKRFIMTSTSFISFFKFHYSKNVSCYHQSLGDVGVHFSTSAYKTNVKSWNKQTVSFSNNQDLSFHNKVTRAEVMLSNFIV